MKTNDTEALGRQIKAWSKPDTVNQPVRTAHTFATVHNTETQRQYFFFDIPRNIKIHHLINQLLLATKKTKKHSTMVIVQY